MRGMDDMDLLYDKLMNVYEWGNMEEGTMFLDDKAQLVPQNLRSLFVQVADYYANTNKLDTAAALLDKCYASMPETLLPMNLRLKTEKGDQFLLEVGDNAHALINYYKKFTQVDNKNENIQILRNIGPLAREYKRDELANKYDDLYKQATALY
jgi:hypothetical protein